MVARWKVSDLALLEFRFAAARGEAFAAFQARGGASLTTALKITKSREAILEFQTAQRRPEGIRWSRTAVGRSLSNRHEKKFSQEAQQQKQNIWNGYKI
jgi:hypothetical protein